MAVKRITKPTAAEKRIIDARLKKQYPQMYYVVAREREKKLIRGLSVADRKALESMVTRKLKEIYR